MEWERQAVDKKNQKHKRQNEPLNWIVDSPRTKQYTNIYALKLNVAQSIFHFEFIPSSSFFGLRKPFSKKGREEKKATTSDAFAQSRSIT